MTLLHDDGATDSEKIDRTVRKLAEASFGRDDLEAILAALPDAGGPAGVVLDRNGACILDDDEGLAITLAFQEPFPGLVLMAPLLETLEAPGPIAIKLLRANKDWNATRAGIFAGMGPDQPLLYVQRVPLAGAGPADLLEALQDFAAFVHDWNADIQFYLEGTERDAMVPTGPAPSSDHVSA